MAEPTEVEPVKKGDPAPPVKEGEKTPDPRDAWILELLRDNGRNGMRRSLLEDSLRVRDDGPLAELSTLSTQRSAAESKLSPDQKRQLDELRIDMSQAATMAEKDQIRHKIDAVDPNLGAINTRMRQIMARTIGDEFEPATAATRAPILMPMRMSTVHCHQQPDTLPKLPDPRTVEINHRQAEFDLWKSINNSWYAPYEQTCVEARRRGLTVEFARTGDKITPRFFTGNPDDKQYLPIDAKRDLAIQVDKLVEDRLKELEGKYNVSFFRVNEPVVKSTYNDGSGRFLRGNVELRGRQPSLQELAGIESALSASQCSLTGEKVKIGFLSERTSGSFRPAGEYWSEMKGVPTILMFADSTLEKRQRYSNDDRTLYANAREVMLHEIAHHNQHRWNLYGDHALLGDMGWVRAENRTQDWMLRGKNGEFYKVIPAETGTSRQWMLVDKKGEAVDGAGKPLAAGKEIKIPQDNLREKLLVKPTSSYFDNPGEMHAEAMMSFRSGGARRAAMLVDNLHLYEVIKRFDQMEIDDSYRRKFPDKKGIRMPDGTIAERTPENAKAVAEFETVMGEKPDISAKSGAVYTAFSGLRSEANYDPLAKDHEERFLKLFKMIDEMAPELEVLRKQKEMMAKYNKDAAYPDSQSYRYDDAVQMQAHAYATYAAFLFTKGEPDKAKEYLQKSINTAPLKHFELRYSSLTPEAVAQFSQLTSVKDLSVSRIGLTPEVAATIAKFPHLESLTLEDTKSSDDAMAILSKLSKLKTLSMRNVAGITNGAFEHIAKFTNLDDLRVDARNNAITGDALKQVAKLPKLTALEIQGAPACDTGLSYLKDHPRLSRLNIDLGVKSLAPGCLSTLKSMPQLKYLTMVGPLQASNLKELDGLTNLDSLNIYAPGSVLSDGMSAVKNMPNLRYLTINAKVDDAGLKKLEGASKLEFLSLDGSELKGDSLTVLKSMKALWYVGLMRTQIGADALNALTDAGALKTLQIDTTVAIPAEKIEAAKQRMKGCNLDVRCYPPPVAPPGK